MARLARLEIAQGWYHVINRGHQRRVIFRDRADYADFLERLGEFPSRFGVRVHSYVLMPNHYHVQLELGKEPGLSPAMHWLNTGYGIWFNRRRQRSGSLFQGRYKAIIFDPGECLLAIHYYIHLNPVRVGALKAAETETGSIEAAALQRRRDVLRNYEWSSYQDYAGLRRAPSWLTLETVREASGLSPKEYRRALDVRITRNQLGLDWSGEVVAGILMGGTAAVEGWKRLLSKRASTETRRFSLVGWDEIIGAIEAEWGKPWAELSKERGTGALAFAIWFGRHRGGLTLEELRQRLALSSYAAVAMQAGRLQRALPENAKLRKRLHALGRRLNVQCQC
jgi:REP element-mobilizing transposase RayT